MTDEIEKLRAELGFYKGRYNVLKEQLDKVIESLRKIAHYNNQDVYFPLTALSEVMRIGEQALEVVDHEKENNDD